MISAAAAAAAVLTFTHTHDFYEIGGKLAS
jgi:hypothetical protein